MMNADMKRMLEEIASQGCWGDNEEEDFMVNDYAGGNIDDAFYGGAISGRVILARELLDQFGTS